MIPPNRDDYAWIRDRAMQLVSRDPHLDHEDALMQACQERADWKEREERRRANPKHAPLRVTIADLVKGRS